MKHTLTLKITKVTGENTQQAQMKTAEDPSVIFIQECETQIEHVKDGNGTRRGRKSRVLTTREKEMCEEEEEG